MRTNSSFALDDASAIKELIRAHPFVTIVSDTSRGLVASHYPVLLDETADGIVLLGHVGRPDEEVHELGSHEVLVIVQGEHGYVSSGWYGDRSVPNVPTWNFTVAHLSGTPELLGHEENLRTLAALVDFFEDRLPDPRPMAGSTGDAGYAQRISAGTVGFRLAAARVVAKRKLSQNKPVESVKGVIEALERPGPYADSALAGDMRDALRKRS